MKAITDDLEPEKFFKNSVPIISLAVIKKSRMHLLDVDAVVNGRCNFRDTSKFFKLSTYYSLLY